MLRAEAELRSETASKVGHTAHTVYVDSDVGKQLFLDFWKIPYWAEGPAEANASVMLADDIADPGERTFEHALVLLRHEGEPALHELDDGTRIFARVRPIREPSHDLEIVTHVRDLGGNVVSAVLRDPGRNAIYLPFFIDEVLEGFHYEKYISGRRTFLPRVFSEVYYAVKWLVPSGVKARIRSCVARIQNRRRFPAWPLETSLEDFKRLVLAWLIEVSRTGSLPFIWFWPENKEHCLILTHDVERSLAGNNGIRNLVSAERARGFKSSLNVVPFKYPVSDDEINALTSDGFEVGVHGYSHDAKLFRSWPGFCDRVAQINEVVERWGAAGFRSASTYRNPYWLTAMRVEYDSSFFDTDPYEPQPGGCLSLFPYFFGDILEIPLTLPQDYTLFVLLRQKDIRVWRAKAREIRRRNGLICLVAHPDEGYVGDEDKVRHYVEFLGSFSGDAGTWNPLPRELAEWWRKRNAAEVVAADGTVVVRNGSPEMTVRWARLCEGKLTLDAVESPQENT